MGDTSALQRVTTFLDAFYSGDADGAAACCDENLDWITYAPIDVFPHLGHKQGKAWVADAVRTQDERYSSRRYQLTLSVVENEKVAVLHTVRLLKRSDNRVIEMAVAEVFVLRDGLIATYRSFFDTFDLMQQLLGHDLTGAFAASISTAMRA